VLFSGTVRSNLDPFEEYSDERLQEALQRVHLVSSNELPEHPASSATTAETEDNVDDAEHNVNPFTSLENHIAESGQNLSQGQRQLLCLARTILSRPKILVLDEATSAVDTGTDELIQASIRSEFNNSTLIVIAHQLRTIADFDRILVMGEGRALEFGSPRELLNGKGGGIFEELVRRNGKEEMLRKSSLEGKWQRWGTSIYQRGVTPYMQGEAPYGLESMCLLRLITTICFPL
jgi:ABC-type multidrug transport system fused ATPase/permease subunit